MKGTFEMIWLAITFYKFD